MKRPNPDLRCLFEIADDLVDGGVGIIRHVVQLKREAGAHGFYYFLACARKTGVLTRRQVPYDPSGGGVSSDRESALAKAIGEAVERYCAAMYEPERFPLAAVKSASFACVPPEEFALYGPEQYAEEGFPYVPFERSTPIRWTPALDLISGESCYVPAAMVFLPYLYDLASGERAISQQTTTGLACHVSPTRAAIAAICEVIERDAAAIIWQAKLARPQIRIETLSYGNRDLVDRLERDGGSLTLLDITMDLGVPTILSVLRNRAPNAPALVFATAADLDPERALRRSLEEGAHACRHAGLVMADRPSRDPGPLYEHVQSPEDHVALYCDHATAPLTDLIFESDARIAFSEIRNCSAGDPARDLETLCDAVSAAGYRILLADVTSPDVRALGLSVIRALIPGFHPLFFGHRIRALGGSRLWNIPRKFGRPGITNKSGDNPAPHPFP